MTSIAKGEEWERLAREILQRQGLKIRRTNFRCRLGEIDIIAEDANCLLFVEVRYRADQQFGGAAASVTRQKQQRIIRAAKVYLANNPSLSNHVMRFDVIAFDQPKSASERPRAQWLRGAFDASSW